MLFFVFVQFFCSFTGKHLYYRTVIKLWQNERVIINVICFSSKVFLVLLGVLILALQPWTKYLVKCKKTKVKLHQIRKLWYLFLCNFWSYCENLSCSKTNNWLSLILNIQVLFWMWRMKAVLKHSKVSTYYDQERLKSFQWHFISLIMIQISYYGRI